MAKKKLTPYGDRILVRPEDKLEKTAGGIIIPDMVVQKPSQGVVATVGEGCVFTKIGDKVMFSKDAGIPLKVENEEYLIMREAELMLKYE